MALGVDRKKEFSRGNKNTAVPDEHLKAYCRHCSHSHRIHVDGRCLADVGCACTVSAKEVFDDFKARAN